MTRQQFVDTHGEELKTFLNSECGKNALAFLGALRPVHESPKEPHLYADNKGKVIGYELCLRNFISLSLLPKTTEEVEANYGVEDINQQSE